MKKFQVGVVVGRFQVPELTEAHKQIIAMAKLCHEKYMVVIACTSVKGSKRDPLDFDTRYSMVKYQFPDAIITHIMDNPSDEIWSQNLDGRIISQVGKKKVLLYAGTNGFDKSYFGRFPVKKVKEIDFYRGTELREIEGKIVPTTKEGRCGVIYGVTDRYPTAYPTVDIAVLNEHNMILLGVKHDQKGLRFPGGFVDPTDATLEAAAKREVGEECGGIETGDYEYVCSGIVDDWRYRNREEKVMSTLFQCKYVFGNYDSACKKIDAEFAKLCFYPLNMNTMKSMAITHMPFFKRLLQKRKLWRNSIIL